MKPIEATNQYAAVLPIVSPLCCDPGLWADIWMLHEGLPGRLQPQAARSVYLAECLETQLQSPRVLEPHHWSKQLEYLFM